MHIVIGKAATETTVMHFACPKGHKLIASKPITIGFYAETSDLGPPICPHCLVEFVRTEFPMLEVRAPTRAIPVTVPQGIAINAADLAVVPGMVVAQQCPAKGCILMEHPATPNEHINSARQPFVVATP